MDRACRQCGGTGKLEIQRQDFETGEMVSIGVAICMSCDGTGHDRDWHERQCADCGQNFGYNINWIPAPILCPDCQAKYKAQAPQKSRPAAGERPSSFVRGRRSPDRPSERSHEHSPRQGYQPGNRPAPRSSGTGEWLEKACQGCGAPFRYNSEWKPEPALCKACYDKKKRQS